MIGGRRVQRTPGRIVTGCTVAASGRDTRLQVRNCSVAKAAGAFMGHGNRDIWSGPFIMTVRAVGCAENYITCRHVVDAAVDRQLLVGMAVQAMGRPGAGGYGINDLLPRTVMTGCAGTGPIGEDIVFNSFNFRPVCYNMAVRTRGARRIVGEVIGTDCHGMDMTMAWEICAMTVSTVRHTITTGRGPGCQTAVGVMADRTVIMHLIICKVGRHTGCGSGCSVMTAGALNDTGYRVAVVRLCGRRGMQCCPGSRMAGLAVAADSKSLQIRAVRRNQAAVAQVMAVGAVSQMRRGIDQCIGMTAGAVVGSQSRD